jgi:beta-lactamase regulating signal transducer with metallopeptidase domain
VNHLAESFAWCMLQVTIFTFAVACLYATAARWHGGGSAALLLAGLWNVGLLTFLCISPWPRWSSLNLDVDATTNTSGAGVVELAAGEISGPASPPAAGTFAAQMSDNRAQNINVERINPDIPAAEAAMPAIAVQARTWPSWQVVAVAAAWTAAVVGLARFLIALSSLSRLCRSSVALNERSMRATIEELCHRMELKGAIDVRESPSFGVAATYGWRKPVVLLPPMWREWTPDQRRAVLAHELAHIYERHFPKQFCSQLIVVAHFYHPLVHWLAWRLRFEQEVAADTLAARIIGHRRYASALAAIALRAAQPTGPAASLSLYMSSPYLMRRLVMLRKTTKPNHRYKQARLSFALSLVALAGLAAAGVRAGQPANSNESAKPTSAAAEEATLVDSDATRQPATTTKAPTPECYATALFRVSREPERVLGGASSQSDAAWEVFCKTQIALLKSYFVLQAAVRNPNVATLPMIASADEPVGALAQRLQVGFYPGSEILYVRMGCSRGDEADVVKIVDAVAKAYEEEVVFSDRQRQLTTRDLVAQMQKKLKDELTRKMEDYHDIAREAGGVDSGPGQVAQQLDIRRLERIEEELLRLENDQLELETSGKSGNPKFYERRITQLGGRQADLEKRIMVRSETSVDLSERRRELEQLRRIADELSTKLESMDIEASAPSRIEQLQPAVVSDASNTPGPTRGD